MITGKRVRLRAIEREDLPRFVTWLNDPEVTEFINAYLPKSQVMEEKWFEETMRRSPDEYPLLIEGDTAEGWLPLGNVSLMHINYRTRAAEVGLFIGEKRFWNQGFGTEAMRLILRHGFNTLNLHRIFLRVNATNLRGIRSYEKNGFILEGRLRQDYFLNGIYNDTLLMSVLRPEWKDE